MVMDTQRPWNDPNFIWSEPPSLKYVINHIAPSEGFVLEDNLDVVLDFYYKILKESQNYTWDEMAFIFYYPDVINHREFRKDPKYIENLRIRSRDTRPPSAYLPPFENYDKGPSRRRVMSERDPSWHNSKKSKNFKRALDAALFNECSQIDHCPFKTLIKNKV